MPTYHATISVTLRPSILDPEGKAVHHALQNLGYTTVQDVRVGKRIELTLQADTEADARQTADAACESVLANPVTENYAIEISEASSVSS